MAETGPDKYLAFRAQTEAVGNFITDFQAHSYNDRAEEAESVRVYVENIKKAQDVATQSYRTVTFAGDCCAGAYAQLTGAEQTRFQTLTGLS